MEIHSVCLQDYSSGVTLNITRLNKYQNSLQIS